MRALLHKYSAVFGVGLQSNLVYRVNFGVRGFFSFFHLLVVFTLWSAAYADKPLIAGFTFAQTFTYFVAMIVVQFMIGAFNEDYQISDEIRNGLINQFLLKPVNYFLYRFSIYASARLVTGLLILIPVVVTYPLLAKHLTLPHEWWRFVLAVPALFMSALIQFGIAYCFGLLSFWFLEIQGFVILSMAVESMLGGQIFPLDLLPNWLFNASAGLPYFYQMYFPVALLTGRIGGLETVLPMMAIQAFWVVVILLCCQVLWRRGLRLHTAVGG
ncbi:MAG TPA: ABC-2 family transporter protein [Lacunisphaera sp.]|jgi:ABC-2 type transport system permease protein|nr:ABC-2 family transporter protein [Lacunisphaera sp.]